MPNPIYLPKRNDNWSQMLPQILGQMMQTKFQHKMAMERADKELVLNKQLQDYKLSLRKEEIQAQGEKEKEVITTEGKLKEKMPPKSFEFGGKRWVAEMSADGVPQMRELKTRTGESVVEKQPGWSDPIETVVAGKKILVQRNIKTNQIRAIGGSNVTVNLADKVAEQVGKDEASIRVGFKKPRFRKEVVSQVLAEIGRFEWQAMNEQQQSKKVREKAFELIKTAIPGATFELRNGQLGFYDNSGLISGWEE